MIGKSQIKHVSSLHHKKFRREYGQFIAEGAKVIRELLSSEFVLHELYSTGGKDSLFDGYDVTLVSDGDLRKMSALTTPAGCLAVFEIPREIEPDFKGLTVALDDIRDPGNLGTIIRICDWFGVEQIVCSPESVDVYNPKVVQATMGSLARVRVTYAGLASVVKRSPAVYGAFMDGTNIYETKFQPDSIVVFGNESNGITDEVSKLVSERISIPRFGVHQKTESLNVATAAAIILSEFRRREKS